MKISNRLCLWLPGAFADSWRIYLHYLRLFDINFLACTDTFHPSKAVLCHSRAWIVDALGWRCQMLFGSDIIWLFDESYLYHGPGYDLPC